MGIMILLLYIGEDLNINCLGQRYKLGMIYDHSCNELHEATKTRKAKNLFQNLLPSSKVEQVYDLSSLDVINSNNLYSKCCIDDSLKLNILTDLAKPCGA